MGVKFYILKNMEHQILLFEEFWNLKSSFQIACPNI